MMDRQTCSCVFFVVPMYDDSYCQWIKKESYYHDVGPEENKEKNNDFFWLSFPHARSYLYTHIRQCQIFRIMLFGSYSRKYGKPRRKRKKKVF